MEGQEEEEEYEGEKERRCGSQLETLRAAAAGTQRD